jgi:hypothetical protein
MRSTVLVLVMISLISPGCWTSTRHEIQGLEAPVMKAQLNRTDYEVLGKAEGEGCVKYYGLWPLPLFWLTLPLDSGKIYGVGSWSLAKNLAIYNALQKIPDADAVVLPRFESRYERIFVWYRETCVKVRAKAIRLKTDAELSGTEAGE